MLPWGTPLSPSAPAFDVDNQSRASQEQQVGFNHDLVLFYPLPRFIARSAVNEGAAVRRNLSFRSSPR